MLVVDDNRDAAELIATGLRKFGYETAAAFDAVNAMELAHTLKPTLAILDLGLPLVDGLGLSHSIRQSMQGNAPRFIALTGYAQEADRQKSHEHGFEVHLIKPIQLNELIAAIERR